METKVKSLEFCKGTKIRLQVLYSATVKIFSIITKNKHLIDSNVELLHQWKAYTTNGLGVDIAKDKFNVGYLK